jgi:hypothetical protein
MSIHVAGPIAYLSESKSAVYFSMNNAPSSSTNKDDNGTALPVKKLQNALDVAYWGEDNRFPQNIETQLSYCGVAKSGLDWKARVLFGSGIIPGKVTGYEDEGKKEIFVPLDPTEYINVYKFINDRSTYRFFMEYIQDWVTYSNCFPEIVFSLDAKYITKLVHQESCDCRFKQMNDKGQLDTVYLSKMWGMAKDQYAKFDPKKGIVGLIENPLSLSKIDNKYIKQLDAIDMYNPLSSAKKIGEKLSKRSLKSYKSAILPVNYPSVNKTYYQVPYWDGARLAGWIELAAKIPNMFKTLYNKAFKIKYHIEVPETYMEEKYGAEVWLSKTEAEKTEAKKELLKEMDGFLSGDENAYKTFISFFNVDNVGKTEYGRIKITPIEDKVTIDKDLLLNTSIITEILMAMQIHPTLFSAGMTGKQTGGGSGSDIREAYLVYLAGLTLERNVLLEPLYLVRDYNREVGGMAEWEEDIVFRFRDTVLTTLDSGKGTQKTIS